MAEYNNIELDKPPRYYFCSWYEFHKDFSEKILDSSHPEAFAYLRTVFRTLRGWGFTSFKTDFLDRGFRDSRSVLRFTPGKSLYNTSMT